MRFDSLGGLTIEECGRALAPANLSAQQAKGMECLTSGIYGQRGITSSASANLTSFLESRLMQLFATVGSIWYRLTWKVSATPSGRRVCLLRASGHRTSDNDCGSWPTAAARDYFPAHTPEYIAAKNDTVQLATWPTPLVNDELGSGYCYGPMKPDGTRKRFLKLPGAAHLSASPWATPTTRDWKDGACQDANVPINGLLGRQVTLTGSSAGTEKRRPIQPGLFPLAHGVAGRVGRLRAYGNAIVSRKSRPSSSKL